MEIHSIERSGVVNNTLESDRMPDDWRSVLVQKQRRCQVLQQLQRHKHDQPHHEALEKTSGG